MNKAEYLASLSENIDQLRAAAELGLEPHVAACPDWTVGALVAHMGQVYDFWSKIVASRAPDQAAVTAIEENRDHSFIKDPEFFNSPRSIEFFNRGAEAILEALSKAEPEQPNWTWWPGNQTAGFAQRRMCHETTIHRWDCQAAHGVQTPITPAAIAADGIDEELNNELTGWGDEGTTYPEATFHLHCTDTDGEWMILARTTSVELRREHGKAEVAVTGPASDVLLWLWGRIPLDSLTVHGNAALAPELRGMLDQD